MAALSFATRRFQISATIRQYLFSVIVSNNTFTTDEWQQQVASNYNMGNLPAQDAN